ncbi:chromosomal replication initiator protein DnaA [Candidatus Nitronereus thalassa]|uniref:Chromosomal replication initiator protein DnaA n=1 Tax=Candidatus Nitronereus thalassa TaxID=3020898 RepID=A0ABU3K9B5_9BACT|nr:chromosomal replication initiator protein DnaA [Candidatus Nitronereus thalassa]MDT7042893.1 chromosomal replication initiator protein DnaA [Candidatus Nitronereus thalassa]
METVVVEGKNIWDLALGYIESRMGREVVENWFHPTKLGEINGSSATIVVPNKFFGEWLGRNYRSLIGEALHSAQGGGEEGKVEIQFVVGEQENAHIPAIPMGDDPPVTQGKNRRQLPNPKYTFDNFVVGASNQFAHAASLAVAEAPARAYNPFFIYGGVGLGKTHLLNSIGTYVMEKSDLRIAYVTTEQFTNEVINSIRYDKMIDLRRRYRNVDMLLIDDIQFLAGKERTQEEFFHTFNTLYEARKQIVLSSDRFPKEMPSMEERLRSRFEWGLIADLQPPDVETRIAILRKKSEEEGIAIGEEVIQLLAENLRSNIRELEGALIRLGAYATLTGKTITTEMAKNILRDLLGSKRKFITLEDVQEVVANRFNIKISELKSKRRTKTLVHPRQIAMFLSRELTASSFPEIGREFGGKDHTTIMHACRQIEKALDDDSGLRTTIESLKDEISKA